MPLMPTINPCGKDSMDTLSDHIDEFVIVEDKTIIHIDKCGWSCQIPEGFRPNRRTVLKHLHDRHGCKVTPWKED